MSTALQGAPAAVSDDDLAIVAGGFRIIIDPPWGWPGTPPGSRPPINRALDPHIPPGGSIP